MPHPETHTTDVLSFSPESTNSNAFSLPWTGLSLNNRLFDSVEQSEPRISTPVRSNFIADFSVEDNFARSSSPKNFDNVLPGQAFSETTPTIESVSIKMDGISQRVNEVLANQRLIIDCLQNNGFIRNRLSTGRTPVSVLTTELYKDHVNPPDEPQFSADGKELTTADLEDLRKRKKKGTSDAYFAVMLLKKYTTSEERQNCTVFGEGPKSKGLPKDTLGKIRKGYELIYSSESWGDAIKPMDNHMRKYCSK